MALIKCPECGKEISEQAPQCPNCGRPIAIQYNQPNMRQALQQNTPNMQSYQQVPPNNQTAKDRKKKNSTLSVWAAVLGIFTCTAYIGGILAIIDLIKNKNDGKKHLGSYFALVMCVIVTIIFMSNIGKTDKDSSSVKKAGEISTQENVSETTNSSQTQESTSAEEEHSNIFHVGDIVETKDLKITFLSTGVYVSDNQFIQPKDGYEYREFEFKFENISDSDVYVSSMMSWECYADNIKMDQTWLNGDNGLDATLSKGRQAQGKVYFEVPVNAESVEVEYDINFWKSDKIIFVGK